MTGAWDPTQYEAFKEQRSAPFYDLVSLLQPVRSPRVIDLGCGTGELTGVLHRKVHASETLGVDSSADMLRGGAEREREGLHFAQLDIGDIAHVWDTRPTESLHGNGDEARNLAEARKMAGGLFDIVFSNAALHWVPDHHSLLPRLARGLVPGGQLAVQVPANFDHPSHTVATDVASKEPFASAIGAALDAQGLRPDEAGLSRTDAVLDPRTYASILDEIGFHDQLVRLQVYGHRLDSTVDVVEWTKGTLLTPYRALLDEDLYSGFIDKYRESLIDAIGVHSPYFYPFSRILMWGRLGSAYP